MGALEKIVFLLQQEDGYPPVTRESVWAKRISENRYQVDNIPFYIQGISPDDVVETEVVYGEVLFRKLLKPSRSSTFRLLLTDPNTSTQIREALKRLGCESEYNKEIGLVAVEIPETTPIQPFLTFAMSEQERGMLDIEEGTLRHSIENG